LQLLHTYCIYVDNQANDDMQYAEIDHSQFPIVVVRINKAEASSKEFRAFLKDLLDLYLSGERFITIFDASKAKSMSFELRIRQAAWIKENQKQIAKAMIHNIYVLPNAFQRIVLNSIFVIQRPIASYAIVKTFDDALTLAQKELGLDKKYDPVIPIEDI
jgi:hypothetical protein